MNWRRGLLRIWVLLSVCWVAFAAFIAWQSANQPVFYFGNGGPYEFPRYTTRDETIAALTTHLREKAPKPPPGFVATTDYEKLAESIVGTRKFETFSDDLFQFLKLSLVPPIALLFLGVAVWWALSGFRRGGVG